MWRGSRRPTDRRATRPRDLQSRVRAAPLFLKFLHWQNTHAPHSKSLAQTPSRPPTFLLHGEDGEEDVPAVGEDGDEDAVAVGEDAGVAAENVRESGPYLSADEYRSHGACPP